MSTIHPWQFLVITLAGWINRHQQDVIDWLVEENRVLVAISSPAQDEVLECILRCPDQSDSPRECQCSPHGRPRQLELPEDPEVPVWKPGYEHQDPPGDWWLECGGTISSLAYQTGVLALTWQRCGLTLPICSSAADSEAETSRRRSLRSNSQSTY